MLKEQNPNTHKQTKYIKKNNITTLNIIIIYIRLFGEVIHMCIIVLRKYPHLIPKMAAKELKLQYVDFRNNYK